METIEKAKNPLEYYQIPSKPLILEKYPKTITVNISTGKVSDFFYLGKPLFHPYFSTKRNFIAFRDANGNVVVQGINRNNFKQKTIIYKKNILEAVAKERHDLEDYRLFEFDQIYWSPNEKFLALNLLGHDYDHLLNGILILFELERNQLTILDSHSSPLGLYPICTWGDDDSKIYFIKGSRNLFYLNTVDFRLQKLYEYKVGPELDHSGYELSNLRYCNGFLFLLEGEQIPQGQDLCRLDLSNGVKKIIDKSECYDIRNNDGLCIIKEMNFDDIRTYDFRKRLLINTFITPAPSVIIKA